MNRLLFAGTLGLWSLCGSGQTNEPPLEAGTLGEKSSDGWVRVVECAAFSPRDTAEGFVFRDRMWLSNAWPVQNDVWRLIVPR